MVLSDLDRLICLGYITRRKHPSENLFILNYTAKTQYERLWNETTMSCRGLIVDSENRVRARSLRKFFNYSEVLSDVEKRLSMSMPFTVQEKVDGSLGILYWLNDEPHIATRGSFDSVQARKANEILRSRPRDGLSKNLTYFLEIVYPSNRICVDYGDMEDLILISAADIESGQEIDVETDAFSKVALIDREINFGSASSLNIPNKEGFVIKFQDGFRFKIKFDEYVRLHAMIFSVSSRSIWKCLMDGEEIPLDLYPDEIYQWVKSESDELSRRHLEIIDESSRIFSTIRYLPRKEFAIEALKYSYSSILFSMLDGKPADKIAWKMIEPEYRTPFYEKIQEGS